MKIQPSKDQLSKVLAIKNSQFPNKVENRDKNKSGN